MNRWSSGFSETNEISIHYTRTGGDKPPLVMLHGLMTNGVSCWMDLARALENEYDVIMPDARGHGKSSAPDSGYHYKNHANDVIGFMSTLRLSEPILLGHSMGGMTAALVASYASDLLRGLVLCDPTFLTPEAQYEVYNSDIVSQHRRMLNKSVAEVEADVQKRHPGRSKKMNKLLAQARLQTSTAAFEVLTPPNPDYKKLVSAIDIPSLLIFGDSGVITSTVAKELQQLNPKLETMRIHGAGHSVHKDQPQLCASVVRQFLKSLNTLNTI